MNDPQPVNLNANSQVINQVNADRVNNEDDNEDCSICQEPLEDISRPVTQLNCGHHFHTECIDTWMQSNNQNANRCANCKRRIALD
jgi:hypothetical protein